MNSPRRISSRILLTLIVGLFSLAPLQALSASQLIESSVFTSQLLDAEPTDYLESAYLSDGKIYIFLKWQDLDVRLYDVENFIYDGENRLVGHSKYGFKPSNSNWRSWTKYNFRSYSDQPGEWRFVVKLDGQKVLEKTLYVGD